MRMSETLLPSVTPAWRWRVRRVAERCFVLIIHGLAVVCVRLLPPALVYDALLRLSAAIHWATHGIYALLRRNSPKRDYRTLLLRDMLCAATGAGDMPIDRVPGRGVGARARS